MYAISLPSRFNSKLSKDHSASAILSRTLLLFEPWLKASGMPFFPGFTDHGPNHLQRVLDTADWLIPNESWKHLSARDVACLTIAILLHDSAMHITEDGFRALILDSRRSPVLPIIDRYTWGELWSDYLLESRHWTNAQRISILGPDWQGRAIDELPVYRSKEFADLSESDRLFIGEFIRRHHPRLAHEFAVEGIPGPSGGLKISAPDELPQLLDLCGIVARSHGINIRSTFTWLNRNHRGIGPLYSMVPVYHMGILRIADFLDLHAERAPSNLLRVKALRSAISQREWAAHAAITDIRYGGTNDPERLEIIAEPSTALQYTSVLRWVNGIQEELDHTWAILGEVYGGVKHLSKLGLRLRRISSPLEDCDKYVSERNLQYVPNLTKFRAAEPTLLPLLAKPLYGDRPEVGIRELMQNAIDAVNERESLERTGNLNPELMKSQSATCLRSLGADVIIDVCSRDKHDNSSSSEVPKDWKYWVEVVDSGVGMTPRTITDYFLCVGATFRRSLEWQRVFGSGEGRGVVRSGQFGIGTLAFFTLGEEISVTTRHYSEIANGTHFRATLL